MVSAPLCMEIVPIRLTCDCKTGWFAGLFQTIAGLKIRDVYEKVTQAATAKAA